MSGGGHPVALSAPEAPAHEEHGSCDVCGGMHEDDEHVAESESWDNEPEEVILPPDSSEGNDLHKIKKTYPKVNGGDNPMALENVKNKLRQQFADFLAEDYDEELIEEIELVSPWKKTVAEGEMVYVPSKEDIEGNAARAIAAITDLATEGGGELNVSVSSGCDVMPPEDDEEYHTDLGDDEVNEFIENKNMNNMRDLMDHLDSINSSGSTVVTEATNAEIQAKIAALQAQLAAQKNSSSGPEGGSDEQYGSHTDDDYELDADGNVDRTRLKPGRGIKVFGKAEKHSGPEDADNIRHGSYTDADYDEHGNFIGTPLQVFGKAEKQVGRENSGGGTPSGKYNPRTDAIRARAEGLQARIAAAREAGFSSLKDARAGGHPSGSEHTWTGSGAFEVGGPSDPYRTQAMGTPIPGADKVRREPAPLGDPDLPGYSTLPPAASGDPEPGYSTLPPAASGDPELQDIVKLAGAPGGKHPDELGIGLAKDNRAGSKIDYSQEAQAARQRAKQDARADGGGREGSSSEKHGSYIPYGQPGADYDEHGNFIGTPLNVFGKAEKQSGPGGADNIKHGSGEYDDDTSKFTSGNLTSKPVKVFTKAPKQKGRDE
jgi:predicted house-cleaning noncanonical NTP pyrophosphatase (MazG superfamily)